MTATKAAKPEQVTNAAILGVRGERKHNCFMPSTNSTSGRSRAQESTGAQIVHGRSEVENVRVRSVFHPTDFSEASEIAFAHALKITLQAKAELTILHVDAGSTLRWQDFPGVRMMLERWGTIPRGSLRSAVAKLGIDVNKVISPSKNAVNACVNFLQKNPTDLIVLAVRQDNGRMRWLEKSVGKRIARVAGQMTLFVPHGIDGFVSRKDGSMSLRNILLPVTSKPRPQPGVEATARLIRNLRLAPGAVTVLHVGPAAEMPSIRIPTDSRWTWKRLAKAGDPARIILQTATNLHSDLIVMTTDGPDGFLDGLRGTTSELVLRKAKCPVATLPVGSLLD